MALSRAVTAFLLILALAAPAALMAQTQQSAPGTKVAAPPAPQQSPVPQPSTSSTSASNATAATELPVNVEEIRRLAQQQPAVKLDDQQLKFYVLVLGKEPPKFFDFIGDYDLRNGPTKGGAPMTHQEFLNMVTPKELNELFGSTSSSSFAMFQAALVNAAAQTLLKRGLEEIRHARDEREVQAIRERIDRELAALLGKSNQ